MLIPHSDFFQSVLSFQVQKLPQWHFPNKPVKLLNNLIIFLTSQTKSWDGETWEGQLLSCQMAAENLCWNCLWQQKCSYLQSKRREWERNENTPNFWFTWKILSTKSYFVKKGKLLHLTNLNSVLRLIPATRESTVSSFPLLQQLWFLSWRNSLGTVLFLCLNDTCLLLI